jgi:hypothetical protein
MSFWHFSHEKKIIFLTGPQDNRNKWYELPKKLQLNSQKRSGSGSGTGSGSAIRKMLGPVPDPH